MRVQVQPDLVPSLRTAYTQEIAQVMGHLRPDEHEQLMNALKSIDEEEVRALRLYVAGKITESIWDEQWQEWQDRRARIRLNLKQLDGEKQVHVENLDVALNIIAQVGIMYNLLDGNERKELLHHMVERVIVDSAGRVRLELRAPFLYLQELTEQMRNGAEVNDELEKTKTAHDLCGLGSGKRSDSFLLC
jgi:hypothetical protein